MNTNTTVDGALLRQRFTNASSTTLTLIAANSAFVRNRTKAALDRVASISSDGVLDRSEKPKTIIDWTAIVSESSALVQRYQALGSPADIYAAKIGSDAAIAALSAYLSTLTPAWNDTTSDTPIVKDTYRQKWGDAYAALSTFSAAITGRKGDPGASAFNLIADTVGTFFPTLNSIAVRPENYGGWGSGHAHSAESYKDGAVASWTIPPDGANACNTMAGLTTHPTDYLVGGTAGSYQDISFAIHRNDAGGIYIFSDGNQLGAIVKTVNPKTATTQCQVRYDGIDTVKFYVDGAEVRSFTWAFNQPLYFSAALASTNPRLTNITFGAAGAKAIPAIVGYLTNESQTVPANKDGGVTSYAGAQGVFRVSDGGVDVTGSSVAYSVIANPQTLFRNNGNEVVIDGNGFYRVDGGLDAGEALASITFRATYKGVNIDKVLTVGKSKDGATGANAKIIYLASSHQTVSINGDGSIVPQTTTFQSNRTNPGGSLTVWRMYDDDGVARTPYMYAGDFARLLGGTFNAEQGDVFSITASQMVGHINGSGRATVGLIFEVAMNDDYSIIDRISIARVRSGQNGNPGLNAATVTVSAAPIAVKFNKLGAIVSGPITFTAARQNAVGPISWRSTVGHALYSQDGVTFSGDTVTISQDRMASVLAYNAANVGKPSETLVASVGTVEGSATVTRSDDGKDGIDGQPGPTAAQQGFGILSYAALGLTIPSSGSTVFTDFSQTINVVAGGRWKLSMTYGNGFRNTGSSLAIASITVKVGTQVLFNGSVTVDVDGTVFSNQIDSANGRLLDNAVSGSVAVVVTHTRGGPVGNNADFDFNFILERV
jgi:hypothetical protein